MRKHGKPIVLVFALLCSVGSAQSTKNQFVNRCLERRPELPNIMAVNRDAGRDHEAPIWQSADSKAFVFIAGMTIDADGAPNAYNPDDTGLDELANAGSPTRWDGIVTDRHDEPLLQQETDPFPGYYVSCTSLVDDSKRRSDPARYVDATKIPYVVLPQEIAERGGAHLGDFAFVENLRNGKSSFAIYADIGTVGEGSVALAERLGISPNARHGGESDGILYMFFPGSGNMKPRSINEIQGEGEKLLFDSGGIEKLLSCSENDNDAAVSGGQY
jgi:hypothetical protein